jgi:hypothetical protein
MDWSRIIKIALRSILGVGVITYALWFYYGTGGVREANRLRATYNQQQHEIASRELHVEELKIYLSAVKRGDEAAMELAARGYGLVGSNEYLWKIVATPAKVNGN